MLVATWYLDDAQRPGRLCGARTARRSGAPACEAPAAGVQHRI